MDNELTITLDPPIVFNNEVNHEIVLKEPTAAQVEKGGKLPLNENLSSMTSFKIELVMAVSGKPKQIIGQMKMSDLNKAFSYVVGFLEDSPQITES